MSASYAGERWKERPRIRSTGWLTVSALFCVLLMAGCGEEPPGDRVPLSGTVTVGGKPLEVKATIYFEPADGGQDSFGSMGGVENGRFTIPAESGLTPGRDYKVTVITSPGIPAEGAPVDPSQLPKRYQTNVSVPPRSETAPELSINFE